MPYADREKQRQAQRASHLKHKEARQSRYYKRREVRKLWFNELKSSLACCFCEEDDSVCLDFHHLEDKYENISKMVHTFSSNEAIMNEINKCIVVCSNCHRKLHASELD